MAILGRHGLRSAVSIGIGLIATTAVGHAQAPGGAPPGVLPGVKAGGSANIHPVAHIPLGGSVRVMDDEIEQDPGRPYAYVSMAQDRSGFAIIDLHDLHNVRLLYRWTVENVALHRGMLGGMDGKYFKLNGRYYYLQSFGFAQGTPDADLGAVIADVTDLPDTSKIRIVARIRAPETPSGFHNTFVYKHSDGRVLLFATVAAPRANVYDLAKVVAGGDPATWKVAEVPVPDTRETTMLGRMGYHDFYVAYDPATHQDKFYGAGRGGYYVYDISAVVHPKLLTSVTGSAGVDWGHTFTPSPDGRYAVTETEYQYAPLRVYDLQPGLTGTVQTINHPIGAWQADWRDLAHNHEVRWPFVFVSGYEDGLQVFSMYDPSHPTEVGWYYTCPCSHQNRINGPAFMNTQSVDQGAFGVDIRNRDGLIMISDEDAGVWFFHMDGFDGWNGHDWGMPNISSVQDYDHGPEGTPGVSSGKPAAAP